MRKIGGGGKSKKGRKEGRKEEITPGNTVKVDLVVQL